LFVFIVRSDMCVMDAAGLNDGWLPEPYWARAVNKAASQSSCLALEVEQWIWVQYEGTGDNLGWRYGTDEAGDNAGWFRADDALKEDDKDVTWHDRQPASDCASSRPTSSSITQQSAPKPAAKSARPEPAARDLLKPDPGCPPSTSGLIEMVGPADGGQIIEFGMVSGAAQYAEKSRLAELQNHGPLDEGERQKIQVRRAASAERMRSASAEAQKKQSAQQELQEKLARRRQGCSAAGAAFCPAAQELIDSSRAAAKGACQSPVAAAREPTASTTGTTSDVKLVEVLATVLMEKQIAELESARPVSQERSVRDSSRVATAEGVILQPIAPEHLNEGTSAPVSDKKRNKKQNACCIVQ